MFSPSFNGTIIIIDNSVFKRGAKLEIEKLFSKLLRIKISHMLSFFIIVEIRFVFLNGLAINKDTMFR